MLTIISAVCVILFILTQIYVEAKDSKYSWKTNTISSYMAGRDHSNLCDIGFLYLSAGLIALGLAQTTLLMIPLVIAGIVIIPLVYTYRRYSHTHGHTWMFWHVIMTGLLLIGVLTFEFIVLSHTWFVLIPIFGLMYAGFDLGHIAMQEKVLVTCILIAFFLTLMV